MHYTLATLALATLSAAQTLVIPTRRGNVQTLSEPITITGSQDYGNQEFDRGVACPSDPDDTGSSNAVFILANGATLSNVIIGANQIEGVHCRGACTLRNVWFRNVCEDAISALGTGNVLIEGGGATGADDKIVQHNGRGTVTIRGGTYTNSGKLYRSCGNCSNNQSNSPRSVVIENVRVSGMSEELAGINSNFGDRATISGVCGSNSERTCQEWTGRNRGDGDSVKVSSTANCLGSQGRLLTLPTC